MARSDDKDDSGVLYTDDVKEPEASLLKLDARGVPLVPQPSDHKADPLVWVLPSLCRGDIY